VSKVVHTTTYPTRGYRSACVWTVEVPGAKPGDKMTILPTETYRALVGALEHYAERSFDHAIKALSLLREADTGEGT
jgi:hypothetical protein